MLPTTEKLDGGPVLDTATTSPVRPYARGGHTSIPAEDGDPKKLPGSDRVPLITADQARATITAGRELRPDLWAEWLADKEANHGSLIQLMKTGEKFLSDQMEQDYPPSSPKSQLAAEQMEQDSFLINNGIAFMPVSHAARYAGVHRETLLTWIKNEVKFDGEPIESLFFKPTGNHFVSKRSVEKIVNRFETWPSAKPAGPVTLGQTEGNDGYLSTSDAASIIGIPGGTMRRWVRQGNAPVDKPLDVVRDKSSGYFFIHHQDVLELAEQIKTQGLSRGPRSDASVSPALKPQ